MAHQYGQSMRHSHQHWQSTQHDHKCQQSRPTGFGAARPCGNPSATRPCVKPNVLWRLVGSAALLVHDTTSPLAIDAALSNTAPGPAGPPKPSNSTPPLLASSRPAGPSGSLTSSPKLPPTHHFLLLSTRTSPGTYNAHPVLPSPTRGQLPAAGQPYPLTCILQLVIMPHMTPTSACPSPMPGLMRTGPRAHGPGDLERLNI